MVPALYVSSAVMLVLASYQFSTGVNGGKMPGPSAVWSLTICKHDHQEFVFIVRMNCLFLGFFQALVIHNIVFHIAGSM